MLVIRLARFGRKKQAFFRLVAAEKSRAVQKKYITSLGYYNPLTENGKGEFVFDKEKVETFIKNGAHPSQTVARLLVKNGVKAAEKFIKQRPTVEKKPAEKTEE
ncbi:30S ribosomal protein S16 [bacterium DOLZORAL124_38_8]|nr:MAG: 30S ribosomal protein S16 [bacterium DOLZORAL124_38_8]